MIAFLQATRNGWSCRCRMAHSYLIRELDRLSQGVLGEEVKVHHERRASCLAAWPAKHLREKVVRSPRPRCLAGRDRKGLKRMVTDCWKRTSFA